MGHRNDEASAGARVTSGERARLLTRIAQAIGRPVGDFLDPALTETSGRCCELLRLWDEIGTDEGRQQALAALRAIVENEKREMAQR